jgi:hypothetical protein
MNDIYATPKSNLVSGHAPVEGERPGWVWAIFILYAFSLTSTIISIYLLYSNALPLEGEQKLYFDNLGLVGWSMTAIGALLNFSAALTLFMLRKITVKIWLAALGFSVVATLYRLQDSHSLQMMKTLAIIGVVMSICVKIAIYLYARRLARRGVLK